MVNDNLQLTIDKLEQVTTAERPLHSARLDARMRGASSSWTRVAWVGHCVQSNRELLQRLDKLTPKEDSRDPTSLMSQARLGAAATSRHHTPVPHAILAGSDRATARERF